MKKMNNKITNYKKIKFNIFNFNYIYKLIKIYLLNLLVKIR